MIRHALIACVLWFTLSGSTSAVTNVASNAALEPREVVAIQLEALQQNDRPVADAGIARVWDYAHPANKAVTGPIERFARMIKSGGYRVLINHLGHEIEPVSRTDNQAVFSVTVSNQRNDVSGFKWVVNKVRSGEDAGRWMTISVSPAKLLGKGI